MLSILHGLALMLFYADALYNYLPPCRAVFFLCPNWFSISCFCKKLLNCWFFFCKASLDLVMHNFSFSWSIWLLALKYSILNMCGVEETFFLSNSTIVRVFSRQGLVFFYLEICIRLKTESWLIFSHHLVLLVFTIRNTISSKKTEFADILNAERTFCAGLVWWLQGWSFV